MELFDKGFIHTIVSSFANFLDIDDRTKELSSLTFARACVELDVLQQIPNQVLVQLPGDKSFYQDIVIEGGLSYCSRCKVHGHEFSNCRKQKEKQPIQENNFRKDQQKTATEHKDAQEYAETNITAIRAEEGWQVPKKFARKVYKEKAKSNPEMETQVDPAVDPPNVIINQTSAEPTGESPNETTNQAPDESTKDNLIQGQAIEHDLNDKAIVVFQEQNIMQAEAKEETIEELNEKERDLSGLHDNDNDIMLLI